MKHVILFFGFQLLLSTNYFSQEEGCTIQEPFVVNGNDTIYKYPEIRAEFPGGRKATNKYLQENLRYPESGGCYEGKSYLRFVVNADGSISDIKILRSMGGCPECDQEGIRVLKLMPKWIPGKVNGQPVRSYFDIPINFTIS